MPVAQLFGEAPNVAFFNGVELARDVAAGGLASVAGGGKFLDGAETAAFGYLFNQAYKSGQPLCEREPGLPFCEPSGAPMGGATNRATNQLLDPPEVGGGSSGGPGAGKAFPRSYNANQPENVPCTYCGTSTTRTPGPDQLNGDHIIPKSRGGNNTYKNYAPSCRTCNLEKGAKTPEEWKP